eukprot:1776157-Amphidinium_carterae.1
MADWHLNLKYWPYNVVDDITLLFAGQHPRHLIERVVHFVRQVVDWLQLAGRRLSHGKSHVFASSCCRASGLVSHLHTRLLGLPATCQKRRTTRICRGRIKETLRRARLLRRFRFRKQRYRATEVQAWAFPRCCSC